MPRPGVDSGDRLGLIAGGDVANRPLFVFEGRENLTDTGLPHGQLTLCGPAVKRDAAHWPVRGDLAHVRLAGQCFVPHYAEPMPHRVIAVTALRKAGQSQAEVLTQLAQGASFDVLDISGSWCWGEAPESGLVGYVSHAALASAP